MRIKFISYMLFCLALLINPFAWGMPLKTIKPSNPMVPRAFNLPNFSGISIHGPISIQIISNCQQPTPMLLATRQTYKELEPFVKNGILYLTTDYPARMTLIVNPRQLCWLQVVGNGNVLLHGNSVDLRTLIVNGPAAVSINCLDSCLLNILDYAGVNVTLRGRAVLDTLNFNSNGNLSLYWIDSTHTRICACGNGKICLAGVVCRLDATLNQGITLNARSLRARTGFINTNQCATADLWVRNFLGTVATGCSNIYFHKDPAVNDLYTNPPAVTLRMTGIPTGVTF